MAAKKQSNNPLDFLKGDELAIINDILSEIGEGSNKSYDELYDADFREIPVSAEQFISDKAYFGHIGKDLYPIWRNEFKHIYDNPKIYYVIATGGIGIGKDFFAEHCIAYEAYKLGCMRNPHEFFNISQATDIVISLISVTKTQTKNVIFNQLKTMIDGSEWFNKNMPRNKDKNDTIEFKSPADDGTGNYGKIRIMYGAPNNSSVIGENVITAVMDEANFMQVVEKSKKVRTVNMQFDQAQEVHDNILRRMKSRYMENGKLGGKLILISSRQYPDDFVERKIAELKNEDYARIIDYPLYAMKAWRYSQDEFFWVLVGNKETQSRILYDESELDLLTEAEKHCIIEKVPIDFIQDYERNLDGSIRDISGKATLSVLSYLKDRAKYFACEKPYVLNICKNDMVSTVNFEEGSILDLEKIALIENKHLPRAIHLDLSSSGDCTGFAMVHVAALKEVTHTIEEINMVEGAKPKKVTELLPVFRTDIALQVIPPKVGEINFSLIRRLIHDLRELGFNIQLVTADQYQSKDMLQILAANNYNSEHLSVDTSYAPYNNLKDAILEDRFETYKNYVMEDELTNLEDDTKRKKIDHRSGKCFTGDTQIKLLDGTCPTLKELAESDKKEFWVYSCKPDGTIVPALANNCRITDNVTELIEITLDNYAVIKCTPTHPFMLRTGKYKQAKDLTTSDSLMPIYSHIVKHAKNKKLNGYECMIDNKTKKRLFTHTMVSRFFNFGASFEDKTIIHHYDFNKLNNTPENLKKLTIHEHTKLHSLLSGLGKVNIQKRVENFKANYWRDTARQKENSRKRKQYIAEHPDKWAKTKEKISEFYKNNPDVTRLAREKGKETKIKNGTTISSSNIRFAKFQCSEEGRAKSVTHIKKVNATYWQSEKGKARRQELSKTQLKAALAKKMAKDDAIAYDKIKSMLPYIITHTQLMRLFGSGRKTWLRRFKAININLIENVKNVKHAIENNILTLDTIGLTKNVYNKYISCYNHKIIKINKITLQEAVPVYDIEVPIYDNFALKAGIFVHNSKDLSDAVCGACWGLVLHRLWDVTSLAPITKGNVAKIENSSEYKLNISSNKANLCANFEQEFRRGALSGKLETMGFRVDRAEDFFKNK